MREKSIKRARTTDADTLRAEYRREELGRGTRGKFFNRVCQGRTKPSPSQVIGMLKDRP